MAARPTNKLSAYLHALIFIFAANLFFSGSVIGNVSNETDTLIIRSIQLQSTNIEQSDSIAFMIIKEAIKHERPYAKARGYYLLATNQRLRNHNIEAIEYYQRALNIYVLVNDAYEIHEVNKWIGLCYAHESEYKKGEKHLESALHYADSAKLIDSKAQTLLNIARLYKSKGDFSKSLEACNEALILKDSINNKELAWKINNFTGFTLFLNNYHKEALETLNISLSQQQLYKHNLTELYRLHHYLTRINIFFKNYNAALENLYTCEDISKIMSNKELGLYFLGLSHLYMGNLYNQKEVYDSSKVYLMNALNNSEFNKDLHALGHNYCYLGDLYYNLKEYDSAMYYYTTSAEVHLKNKEIDRLKWARLGIGKTHFQLNNNRKALNYLLELVNETQQDLEITEQASNYISKIYIAEKKFKDAYNYLLINKNTREELINEDKIREITKLEIEFEYETRQKEVELVREHERSLYMAKIKQNQLTTYLAGGGFFTAILISLLIFRSFKEKKRAAEEKEVLLKEIHHRVKNNLQVISSILSLQSNYLNDPKIKVALTESQDRVKSMALIHQMLYQQEKFSEINMQEYITELSNTINLSQNSSRQNIRLYTNIENIWFDIDTAVPLGLMVNELLTNAYKYAFPENNKGEIIVEIKHKGNKQYCLKVSDNGVGLPEKMQSNHTNKTLGLNMVNILARQLKGSLEITNSPGANFECHFFEIKKTTNFN